MITKLLLIILATALLLLLAPARAESQLAPLARDSTWIAVAFDARLPTFWTDRYLEHLRSVPGTEVVAWPADAPRPLPRAGYRSHMVLSIGDTRVYRDQFGKAGSALDTDAFDLFSVSRERIWTAFVVASGVPPNDRGLYYGAYALLEELGFAFLHPFGPEIPARLLPPLIDLQVQARPRWQERGLHIHTQHPTELVDFLNGWGRQGPYDSVGWARLFPYWVQVCEWALANRLNQIQWVLLGDSSWARFTDGKIRLNRLQKIVALAQSFGLKVGIDAPLFLRQQNSFRLIRQLGDPNSMRQQLDQNLAYVMATGIDYLMTELGTSEFTPGDEVQTVEALNAIAERLDRQYNAKFLAVKIHASAHQYTRRLMHPKTGQALNINFLPTLADPRIVLMPHTVQFYSLHDPAPTYSQKDFRFLHDFIREQGPTRRIWWYPETAYWVSFDVDVPLFLPLYAWKRLEDLDIIARDEEAGLFQARRIGGQTFFSSGWEWGYWLNDVVTARASYDWPLHLERPERLRRLLRPLLRRLGSDADAFMGALLQVIRHQEHWLVFGGQNPATPGVEFERLNGQAYIQGFETWDDIGQLVAGRPLPQIAHQPLKHELLSKRLQDDPELQAKMRTLLGGMQRDFAADARLFRQVNQNRQETSDGVNDLLQELTDGVEITALRAKFVAQLYSEAMNPAVDPSRLEQGARRTIEAAAAIVASRSRQYRLPPEDIAAWRKNPTVYPYTYLWTADRLYYWWRDYQILRDRRHDPCFWNIIDPIATSGLNKISKLYGQSIQVLSQVLQKVGFERCLRVPETEPKIPH